jgi:predicted component of type VI protein secretion system
MAGLCILDENGAIAQRWELGDQPVAVGRAKTADVTILDDTLSRRHFLIWQEGEGFLIKDLNSQNGTWVDGQRTQMAKLSHDVCIVAGRSVFMFCEKLPAVGTVANALALPPDTSSVLPAVLAGQAAPARAQAAPSPVKTN